MVYRDETYDLRVQFQTHHHELSATEKAKMEEDLHTLRNLVLCFPVADLHVEVRRHPRRHDFHVKTSLRLPGRTLFTGDRAAVLHAAYERCIRKLVHKVKAYKDKMDQVPAYSRLSQGVVSDIWPEREPDLSVLERAATEGDYPAFREALRPYDGALERRVGRWVQRYPELEAVLGKEVLLTDVVEEVYLNALEAFPRRPSSGRLGGWLEALIDPSVRQLLSSRDKEIENLGYVEELLPPPGMQEG